MSIARASLRRVSVVLSGALVLTSLAAPVALAGAAGAPCRVDNVIQGTAGDSFEVMVNAADDGDELEVRGVCTSVEVDIRGIELTITGVGDPRPVLDAQGRSLVLMTGVGPEETTVVLRHVQLIGGVGPGFGSGWTGAAIQNFDGLTIIDSIIRGNRTMAGGAIDNNGQLTITDSVVRGNVGGALWNGLYATATITGSVIRANTSTSQGGAIWNDDTAILTITDSVIRANTSDKAGGAIFNVRGGRVTITDSVIRANTSDKAGGGIANEGRMVLKGVTVTGNTAGTSGGGIWNGGSKGIVTLDATSSVSGNTPDDCDGTTVC